MAAGSGLTANADLGITRTIVGITGGTYPSTGPYPSPANVYTGLFSTQFTAATKSGATEFTTTGYSNYARQTVGAAGAGWTIAAYSSSVPGVVWTNANTITFPPIATGGAAQSLNAVGFLDSSTLGAGNILFFADLPATQTVNVNVSVVFNASTGISFTTY